MYTAPHKVASHLKAAEEGGISYMLYSNQQELAKIKRASPNARYGQYGTHQYFSVGYGTFYADPDPIRIRIQVLANGIIGHLA